MSISRTVSGMRKICLRCGSKFGSQADFCPHDGTALVRDDDVPDSLIGTVLLEQFRIDALIGTGGMGTVYRARQTTIDRDVAVKVLRLELARDDSAVGRFEREAQLAASLDHPNLVRVLLSGRLPDGRLYIVMELLEGRSLADELDAGGVPSVDRALVLIMKLCAGLGAVHAKGIVHRDIKPENVYLVQRGDDPDFVKLVDFGISRALDTDSAGTESQAGRVFGTAGYISPEAATGETTDVRSDIYSVGVLSYQLLTGELPFDGKTAGAVLMQHVHDAPPPMREQGVGSRVPPGLADVIHRALRKDPTDRYQSLAEFVDALVEAAVEGGLLTDARPMLLGTVWGTELAAPGSFLAELLASSSLPASGDSLGLGSGDNLDALLDSAPKPFHSSAEMAPLDVPQRSRTWLWASLGTLLFLLVGFAVWNQRAEQDVAADVDEGAVPDASFTHDVSTGGPELDRTAVVAPPEEPSPAEPTVEAPAAAMEPREPDEPAVQEPTPKKKRRRTPKPAASPEAAAPVDDLPAPHEPDDTPKVAETPPEDDGIDWTVPDFPEDELEPPKLPSTRSPEAAPRNPVVIDEVPAAPSP